MKRDLSKQTLYESVKTIVELEDQPHIHLYQHKLFTLFSVAFQYMLYYSTKVPGAYILRIEDSLLAEKLSKKAKDPSTRKFLQALLLPRKLKYKKSFFYVDFFPINTWGLTNDIPRDRIKGAIIVKNTSVKPLQEDPTLQEEDANLPDLPPHYFYTTLQEASPKTIVIGYEEEFPNAHKVDFPFIKKEKPHSIDGVKLGGNLDWDQLDTDDPERNDI